MTQRVTSDQMQSISKSSTPAFDDLRREVLVGLKGRPKTLPCKLFYDDHGSNLFEQICAQKEYYPTRTEITIMRRHARQMADMIGPRALFVEYGSGSSLKTRLLLDSLPDCAGYIPIEISRTQLLAASRALSDAYPGLSVHPLHADYMRPIRLPSDLHEQSSVFAYFPGSTIGNFEPHEAVSFLTRIRETCGPGCGLLIGVDLKKDPGLVHAAYNDFAGITAQFNINALRHLNRVLGSDFNLDAFKHYAFYHPGLSRVEMHLISIKDQVVNLGAGETISFEEGESIHTESCHKFSIAEFNALLDKAGFESRGSWTDSKNWFSVRYFLSKI